MMSEEIDLRTQSSYAFERLPGEPGARFEVVVESSVPAGEEAAVPEAVTLGEFYPNPTAATATLPARVIEPQDLTVTVYDVLGRQVGTDRVTLRGGAAERLEVEVASLAAGAYVVRVVGVDVAETRRLTVLR
jgi:hypothetical protein